MRERYAKMLEKYLTRLLGKGYDKRVPRSVWREVGPERFSKQRPGRL